MQTPYWRPGAAVVLSAAVALALPAGAAPFTAQQQAAHVLNRIAFGPRPGQVEQVARDGVKAYIEAQLTPGSIALPPALSARLGALDTVQAPAGIMLAKFVEGRKAGMESDAQDMARRREMVATINNQSAEARLIRAIDSPRQLEEVMVDFWYNHFNVFSGKGVDRALIASYERDAIRPHLFGSFRALLGATAKHPAMLFYLDNWLSTGDDGAPVKGAKSKPAGLNENYARELMELHTLGVDGGYTQQDVTALARMLTGWTYVQREMVEKNVNFTFDPARHDHGEKRWLGHLVKDQGQAEGEYALDVLALHPATARHLSYKLAQYFVSDQPPPALVERLTRSYLDSKGELRVVLRTLLTSAEFLGPDYAGVKFKTPYQYVISVLRASDVAPPRIDQLNASLGNLGMPLFGCQTPDGYKNTEAAWLNPDGLSRRIAFATTLTPVPDAARLQDTLGPLVSPRTRAIVQAGPPTVRAAMLLGSPDFMQR
ncbi:MAG: DUF1800 domain-containing protein [Pseudomonadota bacterium]